MCEFLISNISVTCPIHLVLSICLYLYSFLLDPGRFFSFFIFYIVGKTPWTGDQPVARPLPAHRTVRRQTKRTQTTMPQVGFESTIPVFGRVKTVSCLRPRGHFDRHPLHPTKSINYHLYNSEIRE
jgi:hypothetical protein